MRRVQTPDTVFGTLLLKLGQLHYIAKIAINSYLFVFVSVQCSTGCRSGEVQRQTAK